MGLKHGDLRMTISDHVEIDRYKAKMGTDEDVCVVNFQVESREAGQDLVNFLESGYEWVLDAAVSPGTNRHGKYMVFVEMERNNAVRENIGFMLTEVSKIADLEEWKMRYSKSSLSKDVTEETLEEIPNSSESYNNFLTDSKLIDNIKKAINI
jgi:hypothetical protein